MPNAVKVVLVVVILGMVGACAPVEETPERKAEKTSEPKTPEPTTRKGKVEAALAQSVVKAAKINQVDGGHIEIGFKVRDNLSDGAIRTGIAKDVYAVAEPIAKSGVKFKELAFRGTFPLTDQYGKTKAGQVFYTTFAKKTLDKIQFDNAVATSFDNMENLVIDGIVVLQPDFRA